MPITIRNAQDEETDEIAAVLEAAYAEYMPSADAPLSEQERAAWTEYGADIIDVRARLDHSELIVAEDNGQVLGAVTFYPPHSGVHYPTEVEQQEFPPEWAAFRLLGVHPDARGRGIGRVLTEECLRRAADRGAPAVGLHTLSRMETASRMYARMGWVRAPEWDFHPMPNLRVEAYRLDL
ncbi:MAG: GNAT family N-acetyltransferase [Actinomycetota bacterium]